MQNAAAVVVKVAAAIAAVQAIGTVSPPPTGSVFDTLAPGYARLMGSYVNPDPNWFPRGANVTDDGGMTLDPVTGDAILFGGSHGRSQEDSIGLFSMATGIWRRPYPSTPWLAMLLANMDSVLGRWKSTNHPVVSHAYSMQVVRRGWLYVLNRWCMPQDLPEGDLPDFTGRICKYDLHGGQGWMYSNLTQPWNAPSGAILDPVTEKIVVFGQDPSDGFYGRMWMYDPDTDTCVRGGRFGGNTQPVEVGYNPQDGFFYTFENNGVVRVHAINRGTLAMTSAQLTTTGPRPIQARPIGYPSFSWDGQRFGGCFVDGFHYSFEPSMTSTWRSDAVSLEGAVSGSPPSNDFSCSAFDPVTRCYVFVQIAPSGGPRTWVYRPPYL